jgi:hypothetical protein
MIDDPLVNEIRAIRTKMWEECGGDFKKYMEMVRQQRSRYQDRLVTKEQLPSRKSGATAKETYRTDPTDRSDPSEVMRR